jgi:pyruvate dehydrogenase complex dehydrogenase (E1) component
VSFTVPELPDKDAFAALKKGSGNQQVATTMALVRLFKDLLRVKGFGERIVPIIPDEARTFGMDSWFPSAKIYDHLGQTYEPVDQELLLSYKQAKDGQIIHEGITEAGSVGTFHAAGTSYATHGQPMIPLYVFYSMFGFQRTATRSGRPPTSVPRGFMIGATAGGTTLNGEGLQHQDRHSLLLAQTNPAVEAYDPSFAYELAVLVEHGLERMYPRDAAGAEDADTGEDVIFYLTVYNEPSVQPAMPDHVDDQQVIDGLYRFKEGPGGAHTAHLLASGHDHRGGAAGAGAAGRGLGRLRGRVVGARLEPAAARRGRDRGVEPDQPGAGPAHAAGDPHPGGTEGPSSRCPTGCARPRSRSRTGSPVRSRCSAPTGSAAPTPARRCDASTASTRRRSPTACWRSW